MFLVNKILQLVDAVYSLSFCLRVFSFRDAIVIPVNISHKVKVDGIRKGSIKLLSPIKHNMVFIGHQGYSAIAETAGLIHIDKGGELVIEGDARFGQGIRLWIDKEAKVKIGHNFYCNKNCLLRAFDDVSFGDDVLMGWNVEINTSDGHNIEIAGNSRINHAPIEVGSHVWIGAHVILAKNACVANNSVVARNSLVTSRFEQPNILVGGVPARIIKTDVAWHQ